MKIIAFDPGGTTGIAIIDSKEPTKFRGLQLSKSDHHLSLWSILLAHKPDVIICESFDYRILTDKENINRKGIELISRNYIGVIELYARLYDCELVMQKPAVAVGKSPFFSDEKLKRMGIYVKGAQHHRDAMRHLLRYLVFTRKIKRYLEYLRSDCELPALSVEYN